MAPKKNGRARWKSVTTTADGTNCGRSLHLISGGRQHTAARAHFLPASRRISSSTRNTIPTPGSPVSGSVSTRTTWPGMAAAS